MGGLNIYNIFHPLHHLLVKQRKTFSQCRRLQCPALPMAAATLRKRRHRRERGCERQCFRCCTEPQDLVTLELPRHCAASDKGSNGANMAGCRRQLLLLRQLLCRGSTDKSHAQLLKFPEGSPMERVGIDVPVFFPHTEGDNHYLLTKWPEANSLLGGDHGGCTGGGKDLGPKSIKLTRAGTLNPVCLQACVKKKAHTRPVPCPSTLRVRDWSKDLTTPWWSSWP